MHCDHMSILEKAASPQLQRVGRDDPSLWPESAATPTQSAALAMAMRRTSHLHRISVWHAPLR